MKFSRTLINRNSDIWYETMVILGTLNSTSIYQTGNEHVGWSGKRSSLQEFGGGGGFRKIQEIKEN